MEAVEGRQIGEKSWLNSTAGISFECYMFDCREYGVADHRSRLRAVDLQYRGTYCIAVS